jgi:hypothetical protein
MPYLNTPLLGNDYDKAEIHYKRALKFDPNNVAVNGSCH